ncbi:MAG: fumarylacetoacetate hydrolase family protein [Acidimicrobiales bacterium]
MRLVTFRALDGSSHVGLKQKDGTTVDLTVGAALQGWPRLADVQDVLSIGEDWGAAVEQLAAWALESPQGEGIVPINETSLLAPLGTRSLILGSGGNFRTHRKEMSAGAAVPVKAPEHPRGFIKNCASVIGDKEPIRIPRSCPDMVDYEGEVAVVIGRRCFEAAEGSGRDYIAGYTLLNDVSARDFVPAVRAAATGRDAIDAWERNIMCKQFPTFCPIGPEFVSSDEIARDEEIDLRTVVNVDVRQEATLADLEFDLDQLVVHYSQYYLLRPGDIVTTGTPSGVAVGMASPAFLRPGDRVVVESSMLGTLSNEVV